MSKLYEIEEMAPSGMKPLGYLYRVVDGEPPMVFKLPILRKTKCGCRIIDVYGIKERMVYLDSKKHYACTTKHDALESFIARKKRQVEILRANLERARTNLYYATDLMNYIDWSVE